jgi:hypothetical protein
MAFACSRRSLLIGDYMKTGSAADVKYLDPGIGFLQYGELRVPEYSEGVWSTEYGVPWSSVPTYGVLRRVNPEHSTWGRECVNIF